MNPDTLAEVESRRAAGETCHAEACANLWCAVLERARKDAGHYVRLSRLPVERMQTHTRQKLEATEDIPGWFDSDDFVYVCQLAGVSADAVRERLEDSVIS